MKHQFMNKTNGKIASVLAMYLDDNGHMQTDGYDTVEDLLADYGAYEHKAREPYIGDEATAEFVRAWAKHWGIEKLRAYTVGQGILTLGSWPASSAEYEKDIDIQAAFVTGDVEDGGLYTIDELCGEEDE